MSNNYSEKDIKLSKIYPLDSPIYQAGRTIIMYPEPELRQYKDDIISEMKIEENYNYVFDYNVNNYLCLDSKKINNISDDQFVDYKSSLLPVLQKLSNNPFCIGVHPDTVDSKIVTIDDLNNVRLKQWLYPHYARLSNIMSRYIDRELSHKVSSSDFRYYSKNKFPNNAKPVELATMKEMKEVIIENDKYDDIGYEYNKFKNTIDSINHERNKIMHGNARLTYNKREIDDILNSIINSYYMSRRIKYAMNELFILDNNIQVSLEDKYIHQIIDMSERTLKTRDKENNKINLDSDFIHNTVDLVGSNNKYEITILEDSFKIEDKKYNIIPEYIDRVVLYYIEESGITGLNSSLKGKLNRHHDKTPRPDHCVETTHYLTTNESYD